MTMWTFLDVIIFAAGYVASIYSWPAIKQRINGVTAEAADLRAKAAALESKIRAL
jgi:outer membrane murein-binding lipoprotein Lpp